jgi:tetratricopeptide (TPR) repeat protein
LPGLLPATFLQAWVAERRDDRRVAAEAYGRLLELGKELGFAGHVAFALTRLGALARKKGDLSEATRLERRALAAAEEPRAPWVVAHARVELGRALAAGGDTATAESLYRAALERSAHATPHGARESDFVVMSGSPAAAALHGLAELADARGDASRRRFPESSGARGGLSGGTWGRRGSGVAASRETLRQTPDRHEERCRSPPPTSC